MRTFWDRVRHTLAFEIIGLLIVLPLGSWLFGISLEHMGGVAVISAVVATLWNYLYNLGFDITLKRLYGQVAKTVPQRFLHAFLFEAGLLLILQPLIMLYLGSGALDTLGMTVTLAIFYMCYAFVYNLAYDWLFPLPESPVSWQPTHQE
ncbi:PACE efflux transporter [Carnimonas nigrificans]|uniref:PACE efflux transporter n=1 Tax=Carnimonas nigrificans TaxID=64323 RepID=UPI000472B363|nr:PACE efflux transporter [Carnimonas nigrificans]